MAVATQPMAGRPRREIPIVVWQIATFVGVLVLWQIGAVWADKETFPGVWPTLAELVELVGTAEFRQDLWQTTSGWAVGLALAIVFGVALGLAIGRSDFMSKSGSGTLDFLRSVPGVALIFIFLALFGSPWRMKIGIVTMAAGWPIVIQSMYGARAMSATMHDVSKAYRISSRDRLFKLAIPSAMPFIITGIRLAASVALVVNIAAEYFGGAPGLGRRVIPAKEDDNYPLVFALIFVAGILGVVLNRFVVWLDRRTLAWHPSNRKEGRAQGGRSRRAPVRSPADAASGTVAP